MSTTPKTRADAAQNRDSLIKAARSLFSSQAGPVSLDLIARSAGVGIGTLYRHFPTKEALVEAVYSAELDALEHEVDNLIAGHHSFDAMRLWLNRYAGFVTTKHAMHEALGFSLSPQSGATSELRLRMTAALSRFLAAGQKDGGLRSDVTADDVTLCFAGAVFAATTSRDEEQVGRILDLLMAGLKAEPRPAR